MSIKAIFANQTDFNDAMAKVRTFGSEERFLVVGHVDKDPNQLTLVQVGQDLNEMTGGLDDEEVLYVLARYETEDDLASTLKFVYFRWLGDQVPFQKKGRYGVVCRSVEEFFNPVHLIIETSSKDDFKTETVFNKFEENTGKVSEGHRIKPAPSRTLSPLSKVPTECAKVEIAPEVHAHIDAVMDVANDCNWMIGTYLNNKATNPVQLDSSGTGDINEIKENLRDDAVMYILYRITEQIEEMLSVKFVHIVWVGPSVKPTFRAKITTHMGALDELFNIGHIKLFATDLSEINEEIIKKKVSHATGSFSPLPAAE